MLQHLVQGVVMASLVVSGLCTQLLAQERTTPLISGGEVVLARIVRMDIKDFTLECPVYEVLDPYHPCSEAMNRGAYQQWLTTAEAKTQVYEPLQRWLPEEFILVCPVKEVLDPSHPCAETTRLNPFVGVIDRFILVCPLEPLAVLPGGTAHPCNTDTASVELEFPTDRLGRKSPLLLGVLPLF